MKKADRRLSPIGFILGVFVGLIVGLVLELLVETLYMRSGTDHGSYWGAWGISHPVFAIFSWLLIVIPLVGVAIFIGFNFASIPKSVLVATFLVCVVVFSAFGTLTKQTTQLEFPPRFRITTRFYSVTIPDEKW